jgi:5,5'-dehydrodivanillate O-demethylase
MTVTPIRSKARKDGDAYTDFEHTGPGTLAGRFMRSAWQPVHRSADLPRGRAKPIRILGEDFTLYRGESGAVYVIGQRCAHRGTQLSAGWVEGDELRCLYHGWKYDGTGQCVEAPAESDAYAARVKVAGYPAREHVGLVFAYLGEGEPPPFPHIPAFAEGVRVESWVEPFPCNFFQCWENSFDEYHVHFTHRTGGMHPRFPQLHRMEFEETSYGLLRRSHYPDGKVHESPFMMPNILRTPVPSPNALQGHGPRLRDSYLIKVPVDDENHVFFVSQAVPLEAREETEYLQAYERYLEQRANVRPPHELGLEILAGKLTLLDVKDHPYLAVIEDVVAQGGQGRIADRGAERLGRSDVGIVAMRRIWSREMQAIAEGRPAKQWRFEA